ncbi:SesA domain-containing protein [Mycena sanguinolenta]|uniref:SesA domain-containing protein n=1 Tax=Mycena sanguinolenta TaxID=230812 RepID=A0A8H6ZCI3_9AGAR|nr:SesA domain-containing protein [Mycena sanguinolenta]
MAEILGTIATILQLVDTALKAREYLKDLPHAPAEQQKLFMEIGDLKPLLEELQKRVSGSPSTSTLQQITAPLARLNTTLGHFMAKFRPADGQLFKFSKQLAWTLWNKKEAKDYVDEFENIKSLITIWLAVEISDVYGNPEHHADKRACRLHDE